MCALSILSPIHSPEVQPPSRACVGCPETLVPSSVTVPTSKKTVGLAQLPWAASTPNQARRGQPAACALERFGSPCRFGHFDSCATQASPCFPSCTCLRSRDTRTRGRGPGPDEISEMGGGGAATCCLPDSYSTVALCWDRGRPWPPSALKHCTTLCLLGFAINPARSCQTRGFGNAKRLGGQSKACSEAPKSLKRPGTQGSCPSRKPCRAFMRHPPSWSMRTPRVPCVQPPTYSQPIVHHHTVAVAAELQRCFVLGRRIALGYTSPSYVIHRGRVCEGPAASGNLSTHEVQHGAIGSDRHDLSTSTSRQGLSRRTLLAGTSCPGFPRLSRNRGVVSRSSRGRY